jgi:hypothetical protein
MKKIFIPILLVLVVLLFAACAAGPNEMKSSGDEVAGFWLGLWHGLIAPITFIISLFNDNVNIYEVVNNGGWYNFGFILGVMIIFGGGGGGSSRAARKRG